MRPIPAVIACLLAVACAPERTGATLSYRATLQAPTKGLGLHSDGNTGHAGMFDTNCPFETRMGSVTGDFDLPDAGEEITDVGTSELGPDSVLATLGDGVFVFDKDDGTYVSFDWTVPGLTDAAFGPDGVVALHDDGGCAVTWFDGAGAIATAPAPACDATTGFDVDPATGTAFVAGGDVAIATADEVVTAEAGGDLVAWDEATGLAYVASAGGTDVTAIEPDGRARWTATLDGLVVALDDAGGDGGVIVSVAAAEGGLVVLLDAETGDETSRVETPEAAAAVDTSADGSTVALVTAREAYFYGLAR